MDILELEAKTVELSSSERDCIGSCRVGGSLSLMYCSDASCFTRLDSGGRYEGRYVCSTGKSTVSCDGGAVDGLAIAFLGVAWFWTIYAARELSAKATAVVVAVWSINCSTAGKPLDWCMRIIRTTLVSGEEQRGIVRPHSCLGPRPALPNRGIMTLHDYLYCVHQVLRRERVFGISFYLCFLSGIYCTW